MFSGSLVAIVTPMLANGAIDRAAWLRLLDFHLDNGTAGIVVGGTTGESATLLEGELRELTTSALEHVAGRMKVIAGAGTSSTAETVARVRWLSALGVDGLLIVTPAYVKPTQDGLIRHYTAAAEASSVPILLYNVPGRTAVDLLPPTVARLATVPNIVGLKEAVGEIERVRDLQRLAPGLAVLSGDDATCREAVLAGAKGVISVTANVAPREMAAMIEAALAGDATRAARIDTRLEALHENLFLEANPIPVKWVLEQMGLIGPGIRLPLTPLSSRFHTRVRSAMERAGLTG
ncbi:MAG: 4-hydroxy-tetrahydrodipicolinate synthase [Sinobacteraceae bacterium]|nr:4-hydroxy-tetrahydrodipicolinate synthase [Nevskiaceae bacterium]